MKKIIIAAAVTVLVMFALPALIQTAGRGGAGFALYVLDFAVFSPGFSIGIGVFSGKELKKRWYLPLGGAALYAASAWIFIEFPSVENLLFAGCYLMLGMAAAGVSALVRRTKDISE